MCDINLTRMWARGIMVT